MCRYLRPTVFFKLLLTQFLKLWLNVLKLYTQNHKTHIHNMQNIRHLLQKQKLTSKTFFTYFFCFDVEMWWNGSFLPWMCIPQISINCKMLYQYGPKFLKNAFSTFESMPRRIKAVLKVKRGQTHWYGVPINPLGECIYSTVFTL